MKPFIRYILFFLLKVVFININAQVLHDRAFGTGGWDAAYDIIITSDSNYVMLGRHYQHIYVAKADTALQPIWERRHFIPSINWQPNSICEIGDTSFVIGGVIDNKGYLLKINSIGDSLYSVLDTTITGNNVANLRVAPDGNLLAMVSFDNYGASLLKLDNELNVLSSITNITPAPRGMEVIDSSIYLLIRDSTNNLLIVNNNFNQVDTVDVPIDFPVYLKTSFDKNQLIVEGSNLGIRRFVYLNLIGIVNTICDSIFYHFKYDFKPVNIKNNWVYLASYDNGQFGRDIQLYFTDTCGQILHDTILYRWAWGQPLDEIGVKLLVNHDGNYVLYGQAEAGPLGDWDIFMIIYKKWDGFNNNDSLDTNDTDISPITTEVNIYPNPTQTQITITGITENNSITVIDMMGKIIYQTISSTNLTQINTTHWAKGIYIVQVKGIQSSTTLKIIKQ